MSTALPKTPGLQNVVTKYSTPYLVPSDPQRLRQTSLPCKSQAPPFKKKHRRIGSAYPRCSSKDYTPNRIPTRHAMALVHYFVTRFTLAPLAIVVQRPHHGCLQRLVPPKSDTPNTSLGSAAEAAAFRYPLGTTLLEKTRYQGDEILGTHWANHRGPPSDCPVGPKNSDAPRRHAVGGNALSG